MCLIQNVSSSKSKLVLRTRLSYLIFDYNKKQQERGRLGKGERYVILEKSSQDSFWSIFYISILMQALFFFAALKELNKTINLSSKMNL